MQINKLQKNALLRNDKYGFLQENSILTTQYFYVIEMHSVVINLT